MRGANADTLPAIVNMLDRAATVQRGHRNNTATQQLRSKYYSIHCHWLQEGCGAGGPISKSSMAEWSIGQINRRSSLSAIDSWLTSIDDGDLQLSLFDGTYRRR